VEHAGVDGELRPFDVERFDHAAVTGFALDGRHANLPGACSACHKERSFVTLSTSCVSCHADVHKGTLGQDCASCHTTTTDFDQLSPAFSHSQTDFPLRGAHQAEACASCHSGPVFEPRATQGCASCHRDPHRPALGQDCAACHTEVSWRTQKLDHSRTSFPLRGLHAEVECIACHAQPALRVKPPSATCAGCHEDVHRGSFAGQDCAACHTETGFRSAPFDHRATTFALTGAHAPLACNACHEPGTTPLVTSRTAGAVVDFRGLESTCGSCHVDPHAGELGDACESCHTTTDFQVERYTHVRTSTFFEGQHAPVPCEGCHVEPAPIAARTGQPQPVARFASLPAECVSCHRDVHLGQLDQWCEACHTVDQPRFIPGAFAHGETAFALTGHHETTECAECHKPETGPFPSGVGTAIRYAGLAQECRACHADVHLGQLDTACETCHDTTRFRIDGYRHRGGALNGFFTGSHTRASCEACHPSITGACPAGHGTAVRFDTDTRCVACHEDRHRGSLGTRCIDCHRP